MMPPAKESEPRPEHPAFEVLLGPCRDHWELWGWDPRKKEWRLWQRYMSERAAQKEAENSGLPQIIRHVRRCSHREIRILRGADAIR